jgi:hypothetical protein
MNKSIFIIIFLTLLQGCSTVKPVDVSNVRKQAIPQDPFLDTLRMGYLEFYDYEINT